MLFSFMELLGAPAKLKSDFGKPLQSFSSPIALITAFDLLGQRLASAGASVQIGAAVPPSSAHGHVPMRAASVLATFYILNFENRETGPGPTGPAPGGSAPLEGADGLVVLAGEGGVEDPR